HGEVTAPERPPGPVAAPRAAVLVAAAGCAALTARPLLVGLAGLGPGPVLTALFVVLLAVGALWPAARPAPAELPGAAVAAVGVGAFMAGRLLGGAPSPLPGGAFVVAINSLAALAEEAFFRRLVYGTLAAAGEGVAVVGSAVLFAAVHVTIYGAWVLPLDLAAGLIFAWQRRVSGSWAVPAVTHVVANLLVVR
ncbi:MAG TPA: CPBP family intramembrane glutamic endopeptidase, partial [Acidimicrobiia bacterium]|nr:CPBP family intramembrane glutamic endopeptidase [Acidimicrobiia bacterium]